METHETRLVLGRSRSSLTSLLMSEKIFILEESIPTEYTLLGKKSQFQDTGTEKDFHV